MSDIIKPAWQANDVSREPAPIGTVHVDIVHRNGANEVSDAIFELSRDFEERVNHAPRQKFSLYAQPAHATAPTPQQISDYLNGLDAISREAAMREAGAMQPAPATGDEQAMKPLTQFVTYLNDHCIGQTITEESLTDWLLDVMDYTPREQPKHPQKSKGLFASAVATGDEREAFEGARAKRKHFHGEEAEWGMWQASAARPRADGRDIALAMVKGDRDRVGRELELARAEIADLAQRCSAESLLGVKADKLDSGKRVPQVDRHVAEVLRGAAEIRAPEAVREEGGGNG